MIRALLAAALLADCTITSGLKVSSLTLSGFVRMDSTGVPGVPIMLADCSGPVLDRDTTDGRGAYRTRAIALNGERTICILLVASPAWRPPVVYGPEEVTFRRDRETIIVHFELSP